MSYVFITGASSGLGEAAAKLVSKEHNLILNGRDVERLAAVGEECSAHGKKILLFPYDLSHVASLSSVLSIFIKEHTLKISAFVHFAGMTEVLPMAKTKYTIGLDVMHVNYFSATEIISTLLKRRVNEENLTNIVLIGSIAAAIGAPHQPHYCASKGAINALTIALARDLAPRVRVNAISPGSFQTRIWNTLFKDTSSTSSWLSASLLPAGTPQDVAQVTHFLLSKQAVYLTGVNIPVDGGERFNF